MRVSRAVTPGPHLPVQPGNTPPPPWPPGLSVSVFGLDDGIQISLWNTSQNTYQVNALLPGQGIAEALSAIPNGEFTDNFPTTYAWSVPPGAYNVTVGVPAATNTDNIGYSYVFTDVLVFGNSDNGSGGAKYPDLPIKFE
jgi:hypothetical protein